MARFREAVSLRFVGRDALGRRVYLAPAAAASWIRMREAAEMDRVPLRLASGFRSMRRQREIIERKMRAGVPWIEILRINAYPGFSEHHTGRAIDVAAPDLEPLTAAFDRTDQFRWLKRNAARFGYSLSYPKGNPHGIAYEPWHWCFRGQDAKKTT